MPFRRLRGSQRKSGTSPKLLAASSKASPKEHFVRSSALAGSRRSSRRRRSARQRQVRFQPIPQSINISAASSSDSQSTDGSKAVKGARSAAAYKAFQAGKRSVSHLSTKPLARKLNGLKLLNKITLKSFNSLAHQLHQTLSYTPSKQANFAGCQTTGSRLGQQLFGADQRSQVGEPAESLGSDERDEDGDDDDDYDWGSDFDEQSSLESIEVGQTVTAPAGYQLEIGRASSDFRAIEDVIQDRGISGQFKRLDDNQIQPSNRDRSTCEPNIDRSDTREVANKDNELEDEQESVDGDADEEEDDDDEEDEEAELRSLEARQGFKQIRDKLKIILDQRLANYEASSSVATTPRPAETHPPQQQQLKPQSQPQQQQQHYPETGLLQTKPATAEQGKQAAIGSQRMVYKAPTERDEDNADCRLLHQQVKSKQRHSGQLDVQETAHRQATNLEEKHYEDHHDYQPAANQPQQARQQGEFDCQSHCSDASSGLESNHSGSQDSGHSTQHSAYSTGSDARPSTAQSECPARPADRGPPASVSPVSSNFSQSVCQASETDEDERRTRFLKNRLIINSKLESMLKVRSTANISAPSEPMSETSLRPHARGSLDNGVHQMSPETRLKLLEQQRQMSLKLKQKPRRKSAKLLMMNHAGALAATTATSVDSNTSENGSYLGSASSASEAGRLPAHHQANDFKSASSTSSRRQDTLTKQLSMVCLRHVNQLTNNPTADSKLYSEQSHCRPISMISSVFSLASPAPISPYDTMSFGVRGGALSLRQLVKEVIDDSERPDRMTRSIQDWTGSSESDIARSSPEFKS